MLDHENRIAPNKKGQPKDKYVDEIRSAITESLRARALTQEERAYLGRKELVQLGAGPKLLIDANVCPFVGDADSQRARVRVVARILDGKTVMAVIPNPEYLHCRGRKPSSELEDLIYGDLITARYVLRLPVEMENGPMNERDYAGQMVRTVNGRLDSSVVCSAVLVLPRAFLISEKLIGVSFLCFLGYI